MTSFKKLAAITLGLGSLIYPTSNYAQQATIQSVIDDLNKAVADLTTLLPPPIPRLEISCPTDISTSTTLVTYLDPVITGGNVPITVTSNPPSNSIFPVGITTVTAEAIDSLAIKASCTFTVTVTLPVSTLPTRLLQQADLVDQCSFKMPLNTVNGASFNYAGQGLGFNNTKNSLFAVGHSTSATPDLSKTTIAEVIIPSCNATASFIQPFTDALEGKLDSIHPTQGTPRMVGGLLPYKSKLIVDGFTYYDGSGDTTSHFASGLDLSVLNDVQGPVKVGNLLPGYTSGYMGVIPSVWQKDLGGPALTGNGALAVISRTSYGPAIFSFNPSDISASSSVQANPLVYYDTAHPLAAWNSKSSLFNGSTELTGIVFPPNTASILIFGKHGINFCYGPGTSDPTLAGTPAPPNGVDPWCYDPGNYSKGVHAYPSYYQVWAYDANDLVKSKLGTIQPWDVKPYATWTLFNNELAGHLLGATIDPANNLIYVFIGSTVRVLKVN